MKTIATIKTDFTSKFGIPRQSGMIEELKGTVILEPEFANPDVFRELDGFSHIWLIWKFNTSDYDWSPTVRPPKLGGNKRVGVFASRSPFRPNSLGLSCVKLEKINGTQLEVSGVDMMNGTEIVDIKPYVPYSDCKNDASGGFSKASADKLNVIIPEDKVDCFPKTKITALKKILELDPRPQYQEEPDRIYGFGFAGYEIKFKVEDKNLTVIDIKK